MLPTLLHLPLLALEGWGDVPGAILFEHMAVLLDWMNWNAKMSGLRGRCSARFSDVDQMLVGDGFHLMLWI